MRALSGYIGCRKVRSEHLVCEEFMSRYQEDNAKIRCSLVLLRSDGLLREVADTASAITGSSLMAGARRTSPRPARCSPFRPQRRPIAPEPQRRLSRTAPVLAAMPALRRAHDRHRGLRSRLHAQIPAARRGARLDRYVMTPLSPFPIRNTDSIAAGFGPVTTVLAIRGPAAAQIRLRRHRRAAFLLLLHGQLPPKRAKLSVHSSNLGTRLHRRALQIPIAR